ncbi:MAG TPA: single-stranded DNA-binding protein, partial [Thermoclostridium sp.]|nr:single-stranded DNA-binding protein [Thermoclostridium sp.]
MNSVILSGRLTKDPEQRFTQKGTAVCNFNLA